MRRPAIMPHRTGSKSLMQSPCAEVACGALAQGRLIAFEWAAVPLLTRSSGISWGDAPRRPKRHPACGDAKLKHRLCTEREIALP